MHGAGAHNAEVILTREGGGGGGVMHKGQPDHKALCSAGSHSGIQASRVDWLVVAVTVSEQAHHGPG